jgi:hypothetical protein
MDSPYGELDALLLQRFMPRKHVLVDAVYKSSVQIEHYSD